jgi:hypothetical protein
MFKDIIKENFRFIQECTIFIVICFVGLSNVNFVFAQSGNETSPPSNLEWADTIASYAAIVLSAIIGPWIVHTWNKREKNRNALEKQRLEERKEVELKTRFAKEISELVMHTLVAIMKVEEINEPIESFEESLKSRKLAKNKQFYNEFKVKSHVIQSEIQAYFIESLRAWNVLIELVVFVQKLSEKDSFDDRQAVINKYYCSDKRLNEFEPLERPVEEKENIIVFQKLLNKAHEKYNTSHPKEQCKDFNDFKERLAERKNAEAWYEVKHAIVDEKDKIITNILKSKSCYFFHLEMNDKKNTKDSALVSKSAVTPIRH